MIVLTVIIFFMLASATAAETWPGEPWDAAENLTALDEAFKNNMSGAAWNPETRMFWVCCNGGPSAFWALEEDGDGSFRIATGKKGEKARFLIKGGGDFEGICQADYGEEVVYVMVEGVDQIREYDVSTFGNDKLNRQWKIGEHVPTAGGAGSEGITFVPNTWLKREGFVDGSGKPYLSTNGMEGIMLVAHQNGGGIFAFDLDRKKGKFHFVGEYMTSKGESSGLEFDRSTGLLYIWHNTGPNYLEITDLSSTASGTKRRLNSLAEYTGPKGGNLEGFAATPAEDPNNWCLIVDDDCQNGAALMWYKDFKPKRIDTAFMREDDIEAPPPASAKDSKDDAGSKALEAAEILLKTDLYKGYFTLKSVAKRYANTNAGKKAADRANEILADPEKKKVLEASQDEMQAEKLMIEARDYARKKSYVVARARLSKIIDLYPNTSTAEEAKSALEKIKDR